MEVMSARMNLLLLYINVTTECVKDIGETFWVKCGTKGPRSGQCEDVCLLGHNALQSNGNKPFRSNK
jgi:hypothetical protein